MVDNFLKYLLRRACRFKGVGKIVKNNKITISTILMLAMSIFFCAISGKAVLAEKSSGSFSQKIPFKTEYIESAGGFQNPELKLKIKKNDNRCLASQEDSARENKIKKNNHQEKILQLVSGYPIEKMLPYLFQRNDLVAHYLVAIAKKESDWGKHSPKKYGNDCYNYWGYRGIYNRTGSGYSCFDSPEQAVREVGDRIENLINKKINTPEKMVVWKCGSTCAGHDPGSVKKWISDVKLYYMKISS